MKLKKRKLKFATVLLKVTKFIVFFGFIYTANVLYKIGDRLTATIILIVAAVYLILNKLEGLEKRGE